jgi:hypothetical protein
MPVMTGMWRFTFLAFSGAVLFAGHAMAQSSTALPLTEMNFDMWCQEEQHLPADRCDKRLPEDDAAFTAYRDKIENYEVPYLEQRDQDNHLNRVLLHNDPVDHPTQPSQPDNSPPPDSPPK